MSKYFVPCALVLVLHAAAAIGLRPYSDMLIAIGLHFVRGNDVADLLDVMIAGAALVGVVLLSATAAVVYARAQYRSADDDQT
jgi:hypothetical protein